MKFGSVAFFKRLIIGAFVFFILLPVFLCVVLGLMYAGQKSRSGHLEEAVRALEASLEAPVLTQADTPPPAANAAAVQMLDPAPPAYNPAASFEYQTRYPYLYTARPQMEPAEERVCYLTFDDGPSQNTLQILEILERYGIKATFFVTGENSVENPDILLAAAEAGHTIGVHTYSHEYGEVYQSVDSFLDDFEKMYSTILDITGIPPAVFRFAGGSINVYNQFVYTEIIAEMARRGFVFYDWNVAANDAVAGGISRQQVIDNVLGGIGDAERVMALMHDRRDNVSTAAALPQIIEGFISRGFTFAPLTAQVPPVTFFYTQ